jgi:hypothetical protein
MHCDAVQQVLTQHCDGPACHGAPNSPALVYTDFFNPTEGLTIGQMLLDRPADYTQVDHPEDCPSSSPERLINSTSPEESLLLTKATNTQACGLGMPISGQALTESELSCLRDWIDGIIARGPAP